MRRKAKENNFKAVLETMRGILNVPYVSKAVPNWLHDVFLGYGNPNSAHFSKMDKNSIAHEIDLKVSLYICIYICVYKYLLDIIFIKTSSNL